MGPMDSHFRENDEILVARPPPLVLRRHVVTGAGAKGVRTAAVSDLTRHSYASLVTCHSLVSWPTVILADAGIHTGPDGFPLPWE
jgi:hypothetical protein